MHSHNTLQDSQNAQKTVTHGSVYRCRPHPSYRPHLESQEKGQLVHRNYSTGTEVQHAYKPRILSMILSNLLPHHSFFDIQKGIKSYQNNADCPFYSPPYEQRNFRESKFQV